MFAEALLAIDPVDAFAVVLDPADPDAPWAPADPWAPVPALPWAPWAPAAPWAPVSYTHLRAHET